MENLNCFFQPWINSTVGNIELMAIKPDGSFGGGGFVRDPKLISKFVDKHRDCNLYFGVCTRKGFQGSKENVHELVALWVDIDFKDLPQQEADSLISSFPLKSTIQVHSGGGYHLYWLLKEPQKVTTDIISHFEGYLKGLALYFKGDHVHDVSRILRIPGTTNWPDAKKRALGRVPTECKILEMTPSRKYDLSQFDPYKAEENVTADFAVEMPKELSKVDISNLQVSEKIKKLIKNGNDGSYKSRSEADEAVMTALVKAGCQHDVIASIFFDPDYKISAKCLERGQTYFAHSLKNAKKFVQNNSNEKSFKPKEEAEESKGKKKKKDSQASILVKLATTSGVYLFHDQYENPHAKLHTYCPTSGKEQYRIYRVRSKGFKQYLAGLLYKYNQKAPSSEALQSGINVLESKAIFDGKMHFLHVRTAWHQEAIWYDLGDWRVVRIDKNGWEIVDDPPILFRHFPHQNPQFEPRDGKLEKILDFINLPEQYHLLFLCNLVTMLIPEISHPVLALHGDQGSAKTTATKITKDLIDPSTVGTITYPESVREYVQTASHHWVYYLDNLSSLPKWLSDALCRGCTGEGFSKRELYSDDEDIVYSFKHCMGITGINLVVESPDLLDRSIILGMERISEVKCQEEKEIWGKFQEAKPEILGGLFSILSKAMSLYPEIKLDRKPRMADFAVWGCAVAKALDKTEQDFLNAYKENIGRQNEEAIGASPVAQAILAFMKDKNEWEGPSHELWDKLNKIASSLKIDTKAKVWPKDPRWLWRRIREVRPNLMAMGIQAEKGRDEKSKIISIRKVLENDGSDGSDGRTKVEQGIESADTGKDDGRNDGSDGRTKTEKIDPANTTADNANTGKNDSNQEGKQDQPSANTADTANKIPYISGGEKK